MLLADMHRWLDPQNQLVVVPISDREAWEYLRFPLPRDDGALSCQVLAALVASEVQRVGASSFFVAIFASSSEVRPRPNLQFAVTARVHQNGVHLQGSFYLCDVGWGSYTCDHPECAGPLPINELKRGAALLDSLGE